LLSGRPIVVEAAHALANSRLATNAILEANTVELAAVPTLAIAAAKLSRAFDRVKFLAHGLSEAVCCSRLVYATTGRVRPCIFVMYSSRGKRVLGDS